MSIGIKNHNIIVQPPLRHW